MIKKIILVMMFSISSISFAQTGLDEIIVTPTLKKTTIHESLNTVSIITKDGKMGIRHSGEIKEVTSK